MKYDEKGINIIGSSDDPAVEAIVELQQHATRSAAERRSRADSFEKLVKQLREEARLFDEEWTKLDIALANLKKGRNASS